MTFERPARRATGSDLEARTYRGRTMREALARVRRDLGGDAVILAAREVRRRRLFGLGPGATVEVDASSPTADWVAAPPESRPPRGLGTDLGRVHAMVGALSRRGLMEQWSPDLPAELASAYARLLEADAPEAFARALVREAAASATAEDLSTPAPARAAVRRVLEDALAVASPIRAVSGTRRVVALVGPTGVGKTTTIAKLAATLKLQQGVRVGLLTVDAYRIAAVEQLKTYADIIDVPLAAGDDPDSARRGLDELGPVDVVLVDTAGRSPRDGEKIRELGELLARLRPDEVHLVLSAATSARGLGAAADLFAPARPDRLILTKLDEAETLGPLLAVLGRADRPVSYLATGQAVPDDVEAASRGRLARLILGEEPIA
ncbi:flagellar GTP-binding protein [Paludisphaera mucosa]|uniref:Flagellar biosynthesis protein FlhF n=1 Tax=Paludisphaera mucosa TaxID=3030827 RepID=A0ABT6F4K8_9BACT|nr:flagellar GTP-binding protein [Paludisphaera mucosa]MDG3002520.1 flagellar GTP-binding protein [Paludisphaera mucosa]